MDDFKTLIYNQYFKENEHLSNLYYFLINPDNVNTFVIDETSYLDTDLDTETSMLDESVNENIFSQQVLVKNYVNDNTYEYEYELVTLDTNNLLHFLPALNNIKKYIKTNIQSNIKKIFIIYQYYDYLFDNPHLIHKFSKEHGPLKYYNIFGEVEKSVTDNDFSLPNSAFNHKNILFGAKEKLNLELIFVCRNLMLALLYKNIYSCYMDYYTACSEPCDEIQLTNIENYFNDLLTCFENLISLLVDIAQTSYRVSVTFDSTNNQLNVKEESLSANILNVFKILIPDKHIIYNHTQRKFVNINYKINLKILNELEKYYILTNNAISPIPKDGDNLEIITKSNTFAATQYNNRLDKLTYGSKQYNSSKDEYHKSIIDNKKINDSYTHVDVIYYITIIIVAIAIIAIFAANTDKSFITRVFILLILVVLTYIILLSYLEIAKQFTENFEGGGGPEEAEETEKQKAINNFWMKNKKIFNTIYSIAPQYGKTDLYNTLNKNVQNELRNVNASTRNINLVTDRNNSISNIEWHRLFQRTLFIHTTFLVLIVILTYLWLSTAIPDLQLYLFVITIIVCMVLIFNYFKNLHRVVRTSYKQKYWNKMY